MRDYERSGQPWKDDPAVEVIEAYHQHVSEELGTDGPLETFGHPTEGLIGHLVDGNAPLLDTISESVAEDTHDLEGLTVEELAMHVVDDDADPGDDYGDDLPEALRAALAD